MTTVTQAHIEATARANPRRAGESFWRYLDRISVLSGLIEPEQAAHKPAEGWSSAGETLENEESWWQR